MFNCFFSLNSYLSETTPCVVYRILDVQFFLQLISHLMCIIVCSMLNFFFSLSSYISRG